MLFAAAHPERTAGLMLAGPRSKSGSPRTGRGARQRPTEFDDAHRELAERWGEGGWIDYIAPSLASDPYARDWAGRLLINAATPGAAQSFMRMAFDIDVRSIVPNVGVPTLILHRDR